MERPSADAALFRLIKRYGDEIDARDAIERVLADPSAGKEEITDAIVLLDTARAQLDLLEGELLNHGRHALMSWKELAKALGVSSRQAAEQRFLRRARGGSGSDLSGTRIEARKTDERRESVLQSPSRVVRTVQEFIHEVISAGGEGDVASVDEFELAERDAGGRGDGDTVGEFKLTQDQEIQVTAIQTYLTPENLPRLHGEPLISLAAAAATLASSILAQHTPVPEKLTAAAENVIALGR